MRKSYCRFWGTRIHRFKEKEALETSIWRLSFCFLMDLCLGLNPIACTCMGVNVLSSLIFRALFLTRIFFSITFTLYSCVMRCSHSPIPDPPLDEQLRQERQHHGHPARHRVCDRSYHERRRLRLHLEQQPSLAQEPSSKRSRCLWCRPQPVRIYFSPFQWITSYLKHKQIIVY